MTPEEARQFYEEDEDPARVLALFDVSRETGGKHMSETGGTEATGFPADQVQDQAPATAPEAPRQFTAAELAAARAQLIAQGELDPVVQRDQTVAPDDLGVQALVDGAAPAEVDTQAMLRSLQAMQARIDALEREKQLATAPDVVKYTTALADHLQALADANPAIHADPDHTWMPALEHAAAAVNAAQDAAAGGDPAAVSEHLDALQRFIDRHARRHTALDYGYQRDLIDEARDAAGKLAA